MSKNLIQPKRKAELLQILKGYGGREAIRQEVINVLVEVRKVPRKEAQNIKSVKPAEVIIILKRFDYEIEA